MPRSSSSPATAPQAELPLQGKRSARAVRTINPEANQRNILEVATQEFAEHGLSGARIDEIAAKTDCSKRLIYYYFGDKDGLYLAVLENVYRRVRSVEAEMAFDQWSPTEAMRQMVGFRFDHHFQNRDFVRLVMIENIHNARFLERSKTIHDLSAKAVERVDAIYQRGVAAGEFRAGLQALDIHWQISAMSFYNVSNSATFSHLFDLDVAAPEVVERIRHNVIETILRFVAAN